jgi:hypothetical protein
LATHVPTTDAETRGEFLWNVHSYLNEYIRFADTKAALVVTWTSALLGALVAGSFHKRFALTITGGLCFAGFVLVVLAFACSFCAVIPRLRSTQLPGFIFWRSIVAHKSKEQFIAELKKQTSENLADHVAGHLFDLSHVSDRKFWWVDRSIMLALLGSVLSGIMYMLS